MTTLIEERFVKIIIDKALSYSEIREVEVAIEIIEELRDVVANAAKKHVYSDAMNRLWVRVNELKK